MRKGVILYGPPASGKDTIANALVEHDPKFVKYQLLKAGPGNQDGYRMTTVEEIDKADKRGEILWRSDRYDSTYAIDESGFELIPTNKIVVVQLGQTKAVDVLLGTAVDWTAVHLWCPRGAAERRLRLRGTVDIRSRLEIWDQTEQIKANLVFNTEAQRLPEVVHALVGKVA